MASFLLKPLPATIPQTIPTSIPELTAEIERVNALENEARQKTKGLLEQENPATGVFFAAEIHEWKQYISMLETHKEFCQARLRRLSLESTNV